MRNKLLLIVGMLMACVRMSASPDVKIFSEWKRLEPAVSYLNIHYRFEGKAGDMYAVDLAEGDTLRWRRYMIAMPSVWPDDVASMLPVKLTYMTCSSDGMTADSTVTAVIAAVKPRSQEVSLRISGSPENALLEIGDRMPVFSSGMTVDGDSTLFVRFTQIKGKGTVIRSTVDYETVASSEYSEFKSVDDLFDYFADSNDPNEGVWKFYDRDASPLLASSATEYVLASVRADSGYELIYLDSDNVNPGKWTPLMVKARLEGCEMENVYDVRWYDRSCRELPASVTATIDGNIMTVNFPYWKTSLRFLKNKAYENDR